MSLLDVGCVSQLIHAICILNIASSNQQWHWKSSIHIPFINDCPIEACYKRTSMGFNSSTYDFPIWPFCYNGITGFSTTNSQLAGLLALQDAPESALKEPEHGYAIPGVSFTAEVRRKHEKTPTVTHPKQVPKRSEFCESSQVYGVKTLLDVLGVTILIYTWLLYCDIYLLHYTQSGKSVQRLFESNKSQWDAAHSGSHRSQCNIVQISMGRCVPAIIYFV